MHNIDPEQVKRYFQRQCTPKEAEEVLAWFRTPEGMYYLKHHIDNNITQRMDNPETAGEAPADSEAMFAGIQSKIHEKSESRKGNIQSPLPQTRRLSPHKQKRKQEGFFLKAAAAVLIAGLLAGLWWFEQSATMQYEPEMAIMEYTTGQEQQKILTLADGTIVRLNENSSIAIPESYNHDTRKVELEGEAFFDVKHNPELAFEITADEGQIRVLGTQFNVKIDPLDRHVQVAVLEGKVELSGKERQESSVALLTKGFLGVYHFDTRDTIIEESPVRNFTSWIDGVLAFEDTPLWKISRQLQWMYGASFRYSNENLQNLRLYASIPKDDLDEVLSIIASTLEIEYHIDGNEVVWRN